jgi:hypothetical protein
MDTQTTSVQEPSKILLAVDKSDRDQILVRETTFRNQQYIDIRIFNKNPEGDYLPTKKGVTLSRDKMKELVRGIAKIKL